MTSAELLDHNAKAIREGVFHPSATRIITSPLEPRGRQHAALDHAMSHGNLVAGPETERLHVLLDEVLDARGPESESEESEEDDDEEELASEKTFKMSVKDLHKALDLVMDSVSGRRTKVAERHSKSIAMDGASVLARYVKPSDRIEYATWVLQTNLLDQQRNNSTSTERRALTSYLGQRPRDSVVGDCDMKVLLPLITKLERNSNLVPAEN